MTDKELEKIREHIRIHFSREPNSPKITAILTKAVEELERSRWHYPSKGELPDIKEDERILFFVKDTHVYDGSPYPRFALGFYRAIFYKGGKKIFSEQSRGYSCDFLPEEVIAWQYIEPPKEQTK